MLRIAVLLVASLATVTQALKCHVVAAGNLSVTDTSTPQDCGLGSLTCLKVIDFTRGTYTKQCQAMNCTMNNLPNAVANCQNTSSFGLNAMSCCCYGDACNSSPNSQGLAVFGLVGISALFVKFLS